MPKGSRYSIQEIKNFIMADFVNDNGEILLTTCAQNEICINNTFYIHQQQHKNTFGNKRYHNSTIGFIITKSEIHPRQISDVRILPSANVGTEHGSVLYKYSHKAKRKHLLNTPEIST